jgi:hypothetical protein
MLLAAVWVLGTEPGSTARAISALTYQFYFQALEPFSQFLFILMYILATGMSVYHVCAWCPWQPEESVRSPEPGVTDSESHNCHVGAGN